MKKIDIDLYENLGRQLKAARIKKGYSMSQLGEIVGKSKPSIKRYEDATVRVDMDTLQRLCNALDMDIDEFKFSQQHEVGHCSYYFEKLYNSLTEEQKDTILDMMEMYNERNRRK